MADDAFAISPISARPAPPSDADYEAISSAFMETARGRWFLSEFARRNRNADTRMVLDAVARIESTIATNRPETSAGLTDALADIRAAVQENRIAALAATDQHHLDTLLTPIRKGARVVREIAWRWREIGTDGRICDLLETHVNAMEAGCDQILATDAAQAVGAAFDRIAARVDDLLREGTTPADRSDETPHRAADIGARSAPPASSAAADRMIDPVDDPAPLLEAANAEDDAVLDMIAFEMGAPDDDDDDEAFLFGQTTPDSAHVAPQPSLGAALLANGIVHHPARPDDDPLAPIRRMTQAEKIAFFS